MQNVIWCTGYERGFSWIDLPIFDGQGDAVHDNGVVTDVPGMYFVGLHFLYAMSSATLIGVARDAERIVNAVAARSQRKKSAPTPWLLTREPRRPNELVGSATGT